ncbi:hypothetical protein OQA88_11762 [Cercophora sp. LCS_1]
MTWTPPLNTSRPVTVLGAGVLGRRIACVFVAGGYHVRIRDPSKEARAAAIKYIDDEKHNYVAELHPGKSIRPGSYSACPDIDTAVQDAWLVIEAVPEILQIKMDTFAELDKKAPTDCIFGSNSSSYRSSLMLDKVTNAARRRLICNVHFTMPPNIRTVELMTDGETEPQIFPFLTQVLDACGMLTATARKESTGFIFNRLWAAIKREILTILAEGVSDASEIDKLWAHMFGASVTPCRLMDQVGLDTVAFIEDNYMRERNLSGEFTVDWLRDHYISQGKLGLKSAKGGLYPSAPAAPNREETGRNIYLLDVGIGGNLASLKDTPTNGKILRIDPTTKKATAIVTGQPAPDGIAVSKETGRIFWTNMGPNPSKPDGSVLSCGLDGSDIKTLIAPGTIFTPKQAVFVETQGKLYFCDREGMSVHRINADGSRHEILVQRRSDKRDQTKWCVGIAVDVKGGWLYWTQKGASKSNEGRIFRAGLEIPKGQTAEGRTDIELLWGGLPEPIDLEVDGEVVWWTDRGEHPRGCSLNRARIGGEVEIVARHFNEPIGLMVEGEKVWVADLGGRVYKVEGGKKDVVWEGEGAYTGITIA